MTIARNALVAFVLAVVATVSSTAGAASYFGIDSQAVQLQNQASTLYAEIGEHLEYSAYYPHLRSDAAQLYSLAQEIHVLAHGSYGLDRMAYKLDRLDSLVDHVEEMVALIERDAIYGGGHVHGNAAHVRSLLASMEYTLYSLRADVRTMRTHYHVVDPHFGHGGFGGHGHGPHSGHGPYGGHGGGISFGGSGFKVKIGF